MNNLTCIHYIHCPAISNATGYHSCSAGDIPQKEFMHKHDYCEVTLVRSGAFSVMSEDMHTVFHGPCLELFQKGSQHAQFDISNTTYERFLLRLDQSLPAELDSLIETVNRCAVKSVTLIPLSMNRIDWLYQIMHHLKWLSENASITPTDEQFLIPMRCLLEEIISIPVVPFIYMFNADFEASALLKYARYGNTVRFFVMRFIPLSVVDSA